MKKSHQTGVRHGLAAAAAGGLLAAAIVAAPAASAGEQGGASGGPATIDMNFKRGTFSFSGAKQVAVGDDLRIRNNTDPRKVGPHTFTLIKRSLVPRTRKQRRTCGKLQGICAKVANAHQVNFRTGKVRRPLVKAGKPGWNKVFTSKANGDTWFTETKAETITQSVSPSAAGKTLSYVCVIHPQMQGKIKVVAGE